MHAARVNAPVALIGKLEHGSGGMERVYAERSDGAAERRPLHVQQEQVLIRGDLVCSSTDGGDGGDKIETVTEFNVEANSSLILGCAGPSVHGSEMAQ